MDPGPAPALEPGSSFFGLVVDGLTGQPIAGAHAFVEHGKDAFRPAEFQDLESPDGATSDARGRFELRLPETRMKLGLAHLMADGHGPTTFAYDDAHDSFERAERIELLPAAELDLCVRDALGQPGSGLPVELECPGESFQRASGAIFGGVKARWSVPTDAEGRARFTGLPAETRLTWSVKASSPDAARSDQVGLAPGELRRIEVVLGNGARVRGTVRDQDGVLVPGLELWLARPDAQPRFQHGRMLVAQTKSDDGGRFECADLPFEALVIGPAPEQGDFVPRAQPLVVEQAVIDIDLVVLRGLAISGRVLGTEEELKNMARVLAKRADGSDEESSELGQDGAFRIAPLEAGEYLVHAWRIHGSSEVQRLPAGTSDVELHFTAARRIPIRVVNAGGDFEFRVHDLERGTAEWTTCRPSFEWRFARGAFQLLATTRDGRVGFLPQVVIGDVEPQGELVLTLEPGARVTLVHRASSGERALRLFVDGAPFELPPTSASTRAGLTAGAAETVLVPPGALRAELLEQGRVVASASVTLLPGERRRIELTPR